MSFDLWAQEYCLTCDKQVHIDGAAYCSESCRLTDFEKTSSATTSRVTSPDLAAPRLSWTASSSSSTSMRQTAAKPKFYLSPAYDFSNAQPYGTTPVPKTFDYYYSSRASKPVSSAPLRQLTPSSSHSSLCSMQSTSSAGDISVSDKVKMELRAYAVSFEQVRMQRRRSY